jgi:hypothetical protein
MQQQPDVPSVTIYGPYSMPKLITRLGWSLCVLAALVAATFLPLNIITYVLKSAFF